jgi:hypothetical protein
MTRSPPVLEVVVRMKVAGSESDASQAGLSSVSNGVFRQMSRYYDTGSPPVEYLGTGEREWN